jgi:hypothetical protein
VQDRTCFLVPFLACLPFCCRYRTLPTCSLSRHRQSVFRKHAQHKSHQANDQRYRKVAPCRHTLHPCWRRHVTFGSLCGEVKTSIATQWRLCFGPSAGDFFRVMICRWFFSLIKGSRNRQIVILSDSQIVPLTLSHQGSLCQVPKSIRGDFKGGGRKTIRFRRSTIMTIVRSTGMMIA